ncbi:MAG: hypothetical protein J6M02_03160 [Clostridia bacterium]|nr:hypothetical protein [Clostridia bacterium]
MKKFFKLFLPILILFNFTPAIAETYNVATASYSIVVNGKKWEPQNPVIAINGKTYISLTEISELLDVDIAWNERKRQVEIYSESSSEDYEETEDSEKEDTKEETKDGEKTYSSYLEWLMDWYGIEDEEDEEIEEKEEEPEENEEDYSFSLDWLWSWDDDSKINIRYETESSTNDSKNNTENSASSSSGNYVASKSGSKYHLATCSSAKKIKSANKTYFASASKAKAAGYSPCSICIK